MSYERYEPPAVKWRQYKEEWGRVHGSRPLPAAHNLPALTGIPKSTLFRLYPHDERLQNDRRIGEAQEEGAGR